MSLKRRDFLLFLGASAGSVALSSSSTSCQKSQIPFTKLVSTLLPRVGNLSFKPLKGPIPLPTHDTSLSQLVSDNSSQYKTYEIQDDLVLPENFTYDVIATWGESVGDSRFGYNNDYISFIETGEGEGYLSVNHEYISAKPWIQTFQQVIGKSLPFEQVAAVATQGINAFALPDNDPNKEAIKEITKEGLIDLGMSVISIRQNSDGKWIRTNSQADRRITGISGLEDGRYLKATGPAVAIFRKQKVQGYTDKLSDRIIGTFHNCAGGTTPWGTVFSGEENIQNFVPESVHADGSSLDPGKRNFSADEEELGGLGNVLGLAGNKYGWMVEVDPANPNDYGTKHTWLGRYRHEAVGIRAEAGKRLTFYSGCDRRGGHLYKFVSKGVVRNPKDKANSKLLEQGMLYTAKFNPDGTGSWIPLQPSTPVNPDMPSDVEGGMIPLAKRPGGGIDKILKDEDMQRFKQQYKTLSDLYIGNTQEKQGAILIDAHFAANAAGATATARPEDTEIAPDGSLYVTFTSGAEGSDGGPDKRIFTDPNGETPYEYGWIMHLIEDGNRPEAMTFRWKMLALGGEPTEGGAGFANPDNLLFDKAGNLWMVTDMSSDKLNKAISQGRVDEKGQPLKQSDLRGVFGNNAIWFIPTSGIEAGNAYLFGYGPMECEATGPFFTPDEQTLFLAIQHPGEINGIRKEGSEGYEDRQISIRTLDGQEVMQNRRVPIGSNWPNKTPNAPPKPAVVAIRRLDFSTITKV
ncbi:MAG TPA: alkaline phosphatase PhoX [Coleofasciculaceae cyanobacterium]